MKIWLCPLKPRSWRITRQVRIFGVPKFVRRVFKKVRPGDLLVFHVLKPINGIVAVCKVTSPMFEDHQDIWGKNRYPLRVRIEILHERNGNINKPVPLSILFGKANNSEIEIEPYLGNVWITKITETQYKNLEQCFT